MCAAACGIVHTNHDLAGEQVLDAKIPLINFRVARGRGVQAVVIWFTVKRGWAGGFALREGKAIGKRIGQRGELRLKIVIRHDYVVGVAKCRAHELEVGGNVQAIVDAGAAANYGPWSESVSKTEARRDVVAVDRNIAIARTGEYRGAHQISRARQQILHPGIRRSDGIRQRNAAVAGEIAELNIVVAFVVRGAPFVAKAEVYGELRINFPIVLEIKSGFLGLVGDGRRHGQVRIEVRKTEQKACERVSFKGIPRADDAFRDALRKVKETARILRLREIVIKKALFEAELPHLAAFYPCNGGTVRAESVRKARVRAALIEEGCGVVVGLNRGET